MDSESQRVFFFFFRRLLSSKHQLQPRRREDLFLEIKSVFFYIIHILDRIQIRNQLMLKHHVKNLPCLLTKAFFSLLVLLFCFSTENQSDVTSTEAAPKPSQLSGRTVLSCHHPAQVSSTSTDQTIITSNVSPCEPHTSTMDSPHETRDILLPPSAFMTIGAEDKVIITSAFSGELNNLTRVIVSAFFFLRGGPATQVLGILNNAHSFIQV